MLLIAAATAYLESQATTMTPSLAFDPADGCATISGLPIRLGKDLPRNEAMSALASLLRRSRDHGNGNAWLSFHNVTFGNRPCVFALLFRQGSLAEIHFNVVLREMETAPSKAAIDAELAFVRKELSAQLQARIGEREAKFPWGSAWSMFDAKGFQASSGIRYAAQR